MASPTIPWFSHTGWHGDWPSYERWILDLFPRESEDPESGVYPAQILFWGGGNAGMFRPLPEYTVTTMEMSDEDTLKAVRAAIATILATETKEASNYTIKIMANRAVLRATPLMPIPSEQEEAVEGEPAEDDEDVDLSGLAGGDDAPSEEDGEPDEGVPDKEGGGEDDPDEGADGSGEDEPVEEETTFVLWAEKGSFWRGWKRVDPAAAAPPAPAPAPGRPANQIPPAPTLGLTRQPVTFQDPPDVSPNPLAPSSPPVPSYAVPGGQQPTMPRGTMPAMPDWNQIPSANPAYAEQQPMGVLVSMLGQITLTLMGEHRFLVDRLADGGDRMVHMHSESMAAIRDMARSQIEREREVGRERVSTEAERRREEVSRALKVIEEERRRTAAEQRRAEEIAGRVESLGSELGSRIDAVATAAKARPVIQPKGVTDRLLDKAGTLGEVFIDRVAAQVATQGSTPAGVPAGFVRRQVRLPDGSTQDGWFPDPRANPPAAAPSAANPQQPPPNPGGGAGGGMGDLLNNPEAAATMLSALPADIREKILRAWANRDPEAAIGASELLATTLAEMEAQQNQGGDQ